MMFIFEFIDATTDDLSIIGDSVDTFSQKDPSGPRIRVVTLHNFEVLNAEPMLPTVFSMGRTDRSELGPQAIDMSVISFGKLTAHRSQQSQSMRRTLLLSL